MNGMAEKRDERVGKGKSGVRITPAEASYMRDWRLTWWPVCYNPKAVAEQGDAKTKLAGEQDIGHKYPTAKEHRRINTPMDIRVDSTPRGGSIQSKYTAPAGPARWECMRYFVMGIWK
jgi:hypothetical protein